MKDSYAEASDGRLLASARNGDREAFGRLVDRHKDALVRSLIRLTGGRDRAEELAQEAFLRLYERSSRYREQGKVTAYLFRIAVNLLRSRERQRRRRRALRSIFLAPAPRSDEPAQQTRLLRQELQEQIARALASLPLHYRVPLVLYELEGWSYRQIGAVSGCREGTVKSRIHRGRRLLEERLRPYWQGGRVDTPHERGLAVDRP